MKRTYIPSLKYFVIIFAGSVCLTISMIWFIGVIFKDIFPDFIFPYLIYGTVSFDGLLDVLVVALVTIGALSLFLCIPFFAYGIVFGLLFYCRPIIVFGNCIYQGIIPKKFMHKIEITEIGIAPLDKLLTNQSPNTRREMVIYISCGHCNKDELFRYGVYNLWFFLAVQHISRKLAEKIMVIRSKLSGYPQMIIHPPEKILWLSYSDERYRELTNWWKGEDAGGPT